MENQIFEKSHAVLVIGEVDPETIIADLKISVGDSEILEGENIKIAEVRELVRWLNLKPLSGGKKLAVISGADKMTSEAANTLLKTLEEPPGYAQLILTTLEPEKILPTIMSRCQKIRVLVDPKKTLGEEYLDPATLKNMTVKEKFEWAAKTAELPVSDISNILTAWQIEYREKLLAGDDQTKILKTISRAKGLLQTNISVKLLLENLILNF